MHASLFFILFSFTKHASLFVILYSFTTPTSLFGLLFSFTTHIYLSVILLLCSFYLLSTRRYLLFPHETAYQFKMWSKQFFL